MLVIAFGPVVAYDLCSLLKTSCDILSLIFYGMVGKGFGTQETA